MNQDWNCENCGAAVGWGTDECLDCGSALEWLEIDEDDPEAYLTPAGPIDFVELRQYRNRRGRPYGIVAIAYGLYIIAIGSSIILRGGCVIMPWGLLWIGIGIWRLRTLSDRYFARE
ncbi:MAG: hypothetical protein JXJ17_18275 [Anaerolineae bacterium]|nr:hypothetical protein [Anaerolineae bacterium]